VTASEREIVGVLRVSARYFVGVVTVLAGESVVVMTF